ncbi:hypothetical protein LCGC14_2363150, partial [marine sediment metagenome]
PRIFTKNEPTVLRLFPALADEIGLNESLLLLQIDFLISISSEDGKPLIRDGRFWTRQSQRDLQKKYFPFWSHQTIGRALKSLVEKDLIAATLDYNRHAYDKSQWISLNPNGYGWLTSITLHMVESSGPGVVQNGPGVVQNGPGVVQDGPTIPETSFRDLKDSYSVREEEGYKNLLNEVVSVCRRLNILSLKEQEYIAIDKLYAMQIMPEVLRLHYAGNECWWRLVFWKGKKGNFPTPNDLVETVGQVLAFVEEGGKLPSTKRTKQAKARDSTEEYLRNNPDLGDGSSWKL